MALSTNNLLKIISIVSFTLLALVIITSYQSPATGYELSFYGALPAITWIFLILAICGGIVIIIHQATAKNNENSHLWVLGLTIIILSQIVILAMPHIRGYVAFRGDNITHLGMVKDIIATGHVSGDNFYPITHILLSQVSSVTGISESTIFNISTAFFSPLVFFLSIYLLATITLPEKRQRLIALALVILAFPLVYITPNGWSMIFLPLLLFCYFKRSAVNYALLLILLLVLFPFLHPLSSLMVIIALIVIELARAVFILVLKNKSDFEIRRFTFEPIFIEITIFCLWVMSFSKFEANLRILWNQITNLSTPDVLGGIGETLDKIDMAGFDLFILYIKLYGVQTVLILLSLVAIFILIKNFRSHYTREKARLIYLSATFLFAGFLYLLYLLGFPGLSALGGDRFLRYAIILTPLIAGFSIYIIMNKLSINKLALGAVATLLLLLVILKVFLLYPSPFIIRPNAQVTQMDMSGTAWFIKEKVIDINSMYIMSPPDRFADGIIGKTESDERRDLRRLSQIPDHFAYGEHDTLGEQYDEDRYVIITRFDRIIYVTVWEVVGRFNAEDFEKLEEDRTANRLYDNGEFTAYYVSPLLGGN